MLLVNARSRRGAEWFEQSRSLLQGAGIELVHAALTKDPHEMQTSVKAAVDKEVPLVICGGGDGTFNSVVRYIAHSTSVLGVLPMGTGNAFARDLGIVTDLEQACSIIKSGEIAEVDLGMVNHTPFLNVVSLGLTTLIAENLNSEIKRFLGPIAYALAVTAALRRVKRFRIDLITEHGKESLETLQVVIGNGRFHAGPFQVATGAGIQTGKLALYALRSTSKLGLLMLALSMARGMERNPDLFYQISTNGGSISTNPPVLVTVDGEAIGKTPITFGIAPGALKVMAPQKGAGQHLEPAP